LGYEIGRTEDKGVEESMGRGRVVGALERVEDNCRVIR